MLFNILTRTAGVVLFGLLILFRIFLFTHFFSSSHRTTAHADAAYSPAPPVNYRNATIAPAADSSGWILFNTTDPQTGLRTRHARLTAASGVVIDGHPGPPNVLELLEQGNNDRHIQVTLQAPSACRGVTTVHAVFGTHPATLAVKPVGQEAGCTLELRDYAAILPSLLDADILTISAGNGPEIRFEVSGLSWD